MITLWLLLFSVCMPIGKQMLVKIFFFFQNLKDLFFFECISFPVYFTGLYIQGNDVTKYASMCKLKAGRLSRIVSDSCLQFWGGMGYTDDVLISRYYR